MPIVDGIVIPTFQPGIKPPQPMGNVPTWLQLHGPSIMVEIGFDPSLFSGSSSSQVPALPGADSTEEGAAPLPPSPQVALALIDTGASSSCIDEALAQSLNLPLVNKIPVGGVGGSHTLNQYLAKISIPTLNFSQVGAFIGANLRAGGQFQQALIGRDFLQQMTLVYDGIKGTIRLAI